MKSIRRLLLVALVFCISPAYAAPKKSAPIARVAEPAPAAARTVPVASEAPHVEPTYSTSSNRNESWYWGFNIGSGLVSYSDSTLKAAIDTAKAAGASHFPMYFDLRFLWPLAGHQTAIGVSAGGVSDTYSNLLFNDVTITTSILALSVDHYFSSNIGDGFFVRGDLGFASTSISNYSFAFSGSTRYDGSSRGIGVRGGLGYSVLLSDETRLPIALHGQYINTGSASSAFGVAFTVGLLL